MVIFNQIHHSITVRETTARVSIQYFLSIGVVDFPDGKLSSNSLFKIFIVKANYPDIFPLSRNVVGEW